MNENFKKIEYFFELDLIIKEMISNSFPNILNKNDIDELEAYEKKLTSMLNKIELYLYRIVKLLNLNEDYDKQIEVLFDSYRNKLTKCQLNYNELNISFLQIFVNMKPELVNKVNEEFKGYSMFRNLYGVLKEATSITEILRIYHSFVINNEDILQSSNEIKENGSIKLYGKDTKIANDIFINLENTLSEAEITILSVADEHIIIMLRDYGHATTLDININSDTAWINYFIPKVCNYLMIQELPGLNNIDEKSKWAKGTLRVEKANIGNYLNNFIKLIPTDEDMFKKGGIAYEFAQKSGMSK